MDHYYIYCLHNEDLPEYYVGNTKDLNERWKNHKKDSKTLSFKVYKYIRNNGGINNFKMEVVDEICCDLENAKKLERYYIELLGASLNSDVPGRTDEEYKKEYYQNNKQKINKYNKKYYQENKQEMCEQHKEYRQNNRQEISEKRKEKFTCICGSVTRKNDQARHWKSEKHINFIKENIGY